MKLCINVLCQKQQSLYLLMIGSCSVCKQIDFKKEEINWELRKTELIELVNEFKGKYDYDCIVPFQVKTQLLLFIIL